ncbi:acetamidase [Eggerthellaceae bacterium zg-1084]|uniref:Acetamidase n=1 Tax=Berryella wangjianweii TaxID=2734634 RepID=A0A6M8J4U7_9ACTN|nr:acetamidase/formamidase family protein [Berryella wangjianweii]NPD30881.1 acetamidase [Berryella wangjianweii]NPD31746.1 acetamidase [Eggerthellaceae bacterium zg-997]QKF07653.1 acetamidase [Berryella wangjianweii]
MIELGCEHSLYAFDAALEPALEVESGTTVRLRTKDCFSNQLRAADATLDALDWDRINPATGPVFVKGAQPGGALKAVIERIELDGDVVVATGEGEGVMGDRFTGWSFSHGRVEDDGLTVFDGCRLPLNPMIGVIGVAPSGDPVNCGTPGAHGGNMDCKDIREGTTLYLPVAVEGALFGCGDMHACMGDGEVGVSGAEAPGHATITLTALPALRIQNPVIETATHVGTIASADTLDAAADRAVHDMLDLVCARAQVAPEEAAMLFSLQGDVRVCQMVDPQRTVRFMMPKQALAQYGFEPLP